MRLRKLLETILHGDDLRDESKNGDTFTELVQWLDNRSLSLIISEARNDGRKDFKSTLLGDRKIMCHYSLYRTDNWINQNNRRKSNAIRHQNRVENKFSKVYRRQYKPHSSYGYSFKRVTHIFQNICNCWHKKRNKWLFIELKVALRNFEENEKCQQAITIKIVTKTVS